MPRDGTSRSALPLLSGDAAARAGAYAGLLAAYLADAPGGPSVGLDLLAFAAAALWSLAAERRFPRAFLPPAVKIGLLAAAWVVFDLSLVLHPAGPSAAVAANGPRFLFWTGILIALSRDKGGADLALLAMIALSLLVIAGSFGRPAWFLPALAACAAGFLFASVRATVASAAPRERTGLLRGLGVALHMLSLALPVAGAAFVLFPRGRTPEAAAGPEQAARPFEEGAGGFGRGPAFSGIPLDPGALDLAHEDPLRNDPTPVLHVRLADGRGRLLPPSRTPYLRGAVLAVYRDGRWEADFHTQSKKDTDDGRADGWTTLRGSAPGAEIARQRIRGRATPLDLRFALPEPVRARAPAVDHDAAGMAFFPIVRRDGMIEYEIVSELPPEREVTSPAPGPAPPPECLQVPGGLDRLRSLARAHTKGLENAPAARARKLRDFLRRGGFAYRLGPFTPPPGVDPAEHFLFGARGGSCTHFATALALLCRAAGVPARVATGFRLHDSQADGSFLVRNSDAHAWVEVWPGTGGGWQALDATPAGDPPGSASETVALPAAAPAEPAPAERWDGFLLEFDASASAGTLAEAGRALLLRAEAAAAAALSPAALGAAGAAAAVAFAVWLLLPRARQARLRQLLAGWPARTRVDFYRDFLWTLERRGLRKRAWQTPWEFARAARSRVDDPGIDAITRAFCEARYRGTAPDAETRREIERALDRLRV